jgi:hypothetical protein
MASFPFPAHQTGRADFPHPAFRPASSQGPRQKPSAPACLAHGVHLRLAIELSWKTPDLIGRPRLTANRPGPPRRRKRTRSQRPSLRRSYPASTVLRPCPTPARSIANRDVEAATSEGTGLPRLLGPPFQRAAPNTPADWHRCACRFLPCPMRPSPNLGRVGVRILTFEACSGFTRVTARWIAQPPKGGLCRKASAQPVTQPSRLPATRPTDNYPDGTYLHW